MADRFEELMQRVAESANAGVGYAAMQQAILQKHKSRSKRRRALYASLPAAAAFVVLLGAGTLFLSRGLFAAKGAAEEAADIAPPQAVEPAASHAVEESELELYAALGGAGEAGFTTDTPAEAPADTSADAPASMATAEPQGTLAEDVDSAAGDLLPACEDGTLTNGQSRADVAQPMPLPTLAPGEAEGIAQSGTVFEPGTLGQKRNLPPGAPGVYAYQLFEGSLLASGHAAVAPREGGSAAIWQLSEGEYVLITSHLTPEELMAEMLLYAK